MPIHQSQCNLFNPCYCFSVCYHKTNQSHILRMKVLARRQRRLSWFWGQEAIQRLIMIPYYKHRKKKLATKSNWYKSQKITTMRKAWLSSSRSISAKSSMSKGSNSWVQTRNPRFVQVLTKTSWDWRIKYTKQKGVPTNMSQGKEKREERAQLKHHKKRPK